MFISQCSGYNNENMRVPYQSHIYYAILFITLYDDDGYQNRKSISTGSLPQGAEILTAETKLKETC